MTHATAAAHTARASGLVALYARASAGFEDATAAWLIPTLARLVFAGVLLIYFWRSAMTKLGDGFFGFLSPSTGAYVQIFPKNAEAVGYDVTQFSFVEDLIVLAGTWAEFILPALIILGLLTRLAAFGMIGFIIVMSLTDIYGHMADAQTIGAWFDAPSGSLIMDQRALWIFILVVLVLRGGGPLSLDRLLGLEQRRSA
jgi:putative oxidoreductase